jgi:uncharacterized membrane protein
MNQAHLHLITNHLPILGPLFGMAVLAYGFSIKNQQVKNAAYLVFILSALGGIVANWTGDAAAHLAKNIPGVLRKDIHEHSQAADYAITSILILGALSLAGLWASRYKPSLDKTISIVIAVFALFTFSVTARTGYLGGKIRHTEFNAPGAVPAEAPVGNSNSSPIGG